METSPESHWRKSYDASEFRRVLGHFPTGVTVVTSRQGSEPLGMTIGSFTSVSLNPPLVGFLPMKDSSTWADMAVTDSFCVNVLSQQQADLCWAFSSPNHGGRRFDGVSWRPAPSGSPIIERAVAWIDCVTEAIYEMGDHLFVLGRVRALDADADSSGDGPFPLLFFKGALGGFSGDE